MKARIPQTHLGVLAYSMGAAVALMCSAWNTDVEALVADSAFATHRSAVDYNIHHMLHLPSSPFFWLADALLWWRAGYHFRQVEPLRDIRAIAPRPILIIHDQKDSVVNPTTQHSSMQQQVSRKSYGSFLMPIIVEPTLLIDRYM